MKVFLESWSFLQIRETMGKNDVKRIRFWDKIQYGFPSGKRQLVKKKGKAIS